jgi:hypothetical protein
VEYITGTSNLFSNLRSSHLCLQQTGEIDYLIVSWDKVLGYVVCRFHIAVGEKLHADKFPGAIVQSVTVISQDFIKFWGNFFAFVLYVLIEKFTGI